VKKRRNWNAKGKYRALLRVLKVFVALCRTRFGVTFQELLEEAECSRRTLYRYLDVLQEAGVRLVVERRMTGEVIRRVDHVDGARVRVA